MSEYWNKIDAVKPMDGEIVWVLLDGNEVIEATYSHLHQCFYNAHASGYTNYSVTYWHHKEQGDVRPSPPSVPGNCVCNELSAIGSWVVLDNWYIGNDVHLEIRYDWKVDGKDTKVLAVSSGHPRTVKAVVPLCDSCGSDIIQ